MRDPGNEVGYNTCPPGEHFFVKIMSVFLFIRIQKNSFILHDIGIYSQ